MTLVSAAFFSWVQGAPFYVEVHTQAVDLLPPGSGKTWLDIGCGPGLVGRLACNRGYDVLGIDRDPGMVRFAMRNARSNPRCRYAVGDLNRVAGQHSADVVSATSLLFVLPDPKVAIQQLWDCVRTGGRLLVIETSERMTPTAARRVKNTMPPGRRIALKLWARTRNGKSVAPEIFESLSAHASECTPLLSGLVHAWVFVKEPA
jgi:trans-aconitate methyltransferase